MKIEKNTLITAAIVAVVAFGGGTFYGKHSAGTTLSDLKNLSAADRRQARGSRGGFGGISGGAAGDSFVSGEVLSADAKSITVKLQDGGSKIIFISADTKVMKSTAGSIADVTIQSQITATGGAADGGNITAKTIQIRPAITK